MSYKKYYSLKVWYLSFMTLLFIPSFDIQSQSFTDISHSLPAITQGANARWVDMDSDADLDLIVYGFEAGNKIRFFENDGNDIFNENTSFEISGPYSGSFLIGDMNNDGYLDVIFNRVLNGDSDYECRIYWGSGTYVYSQYTIIEPDQPYGYSLSITDYNQDGKFDLCFSGAKTYIYKNQGNKLFHFLSGSAIGLEDAEIKYWRDYNSDGLIDGIGENGVAVNTGDNTFSFVRIPEIQNFGSFSSAWSDFDQDGDLDLCAGAEGPLAIYENIGEDAYQKTALIDLQYYYVTIDWLDIDNDGWSDLFFSGDNGAEYVSKIYYNRNGEDFEISNPSIIGLTYYPGTSWGDYDNDGDLDLAIAGQSQIGGYIQGTYDEFVFKIYRNDSPVKNTDPLPPSGLKSEIIGDKAILTWDHANDHENESLALNYNIVIGSSSGESDVLFSNPQYAENRLSSQPGCIEDTVYMINNMAGGTYYWRVQSVDQGNASSQFSAENTFTIENSVRISPGENQELRINEAGNPISVSETGSFDSKAWLYSNNPGGPYSTIENETGDTYTPIFSKPGNYYVVCSAQNDGIRFISNEVLVAINNFSDSTKMSGTLGTNENWRFVDFDNDNDIDIVTINTDSIRFFRKENGNYSEDTELALNGVGNGDLTFGDIDNNGNIELVLLGNQDGQPVCHLFSKDNMGIYQHKQSFEGLSSGRCVLEDFDNNGYLDLLISGESIDERIEVYLYKNIKGQFSQEPINIYGVSGDNFECRILTGDFDNDGDKDLMTYGQDFSYNSTTRIYRNDGSFTFRIIKEFEDVLAFGADWADVDNDGDLDIVLIGKTQSYDIVARLHYNNNSDFDTQTIQLSTGTYSYYGQAYFADCNNDSYMDLAVKIDASTHIYNNVSGIFSPDDKIILPSSLQSVIDWVDFDGDSDFDIKIDESIFWNTNQSTNTEPIAPDSAYAHTQLNSVTLGWSKGYDAETQEKSLNYNVSIYDSNGDAVIYIMADSLTGKGYLGNKSNAYTSKKIEISPLSAGKYYWSVQTIDNQYSRSGFSEKDSFQIYDIYTPISDSIITSRYSWIDIDKDGDYDSYYANSLFLNTEADSFRRFKNYPFPSAENFTFIDFDNDQDLDLCLIAEDSVYLAENLSNGEYEILSPALAPGSMYSITSTSDKIKTVDFNNDGLPEIVAMLNSKLILFTNNNGHIGSGVELESSVFEVFGFDVADFDNDMDADITVFGENHWGAPITKILENSSGSFSSSTIVIDPMIDGTVDWGDYDADRDQDLLMSGYDYQGWFIKIYKNEDQSFQKFKPILPGRIASLAQWIDFDNDGDLDISYYALGYAYANIFENLGDDNFSEFLEESLPNQPGAFADYDNDGDLDFGGGRVFRNNSNFGNADPSIPNALSVTVKDFQVRFSWNKSSDDKTPSSALSYNIRVGTSPGGSDIVCPASNTITGDLFIPGEGNCFKNNSYLLDSLGLGVYYWSVQAVDNVFGGSEWAPEESFTLSQIQSDFEADTVCFNLPTSFTDKSVSHADPIASWSWDFGDGNASLLQNPVHLYAAADTFQVTLIAQSANYSDTITKNVIVKATPDADFTIDIVCQGEENTIINNTTPGLLNIISWQWDFGDKKYSDLQDPVSHGYLVNGEYDVSLTVIADNGCSDSITKKAVVAGYPSKSLSSDGPLSFCPDDSVTLSAQINPGYKYQWILDGINVTGATDSQLKATKSGKYRAGITNSVANCITLTDSLEVIVLPEPPSTNISFPGNLSICEGDSITISATANSDYTYDWRRNGGSLGTNSPNYSVKSTGNYDLKITNAEGCSSLSSNTVDITVFSNPEKPGYSLNGSSSICEGDSVGVNVVQQAGLEYKWFKDGELYFGPIELRAKEAGSYQLSVEDEHKCISYSQPLLITLLPNPIPQRINTMDGNQNSLTNLSGLCDGDSICLTLEDSLDYTYEWFIDDKTTSLDQGTYIAHISGSYHALITNKEGCTLKSANNIDIQFNDRPQKPVLSSTGEITFCGTENQFITISNPNSDDHYDWLLNGISIANSTSSALPNESGEYQVKATNSFGCYAISDITTVTVLSNLFKPEIVSDKDSENVCPEDKVVLSVRETLESLTYQWQKTGLPIDGAYGSEYEVNDEGYYSVKVSSQGCNIESDPIEITYKEALQKPEITAEGSSVWYLAASNDSASVYRWYHESMLIEESSSHIYVANQEMGKYHVEISDNGECFTSSDVISIPENVILSTNDIDPWENLKIYPNPTPGLFTLEMENAIMGELIIHILNDAGSRIITIKFHKENSHFLTEVDLSDQPAAVYLIGLILEDFTTTRSLIVR